jgi:hypothetical protein
MSIMTLEADLIYNDSVTSAYRYLSDLLSSDIGKRQIKFLLLKLALTQFNNGGESGPKGQLFESSYQNSKNNEQANSFDM